VWPEIHIKLEQDNPLQVLHHVIAIRTHIRSDVDRDLVRFAEGWDEP
jgi:hypothetical protein